MFLIVLTKTDAKRWILEMIKDKQLELLDIFVNDETNLYI